jgi:hypothetical protein
MDQTLEHWADAVGHEGCYQVSDLGNVRSLPRTVARTDGRTMRKQGFALKPRPNQAGYLRVSLNMPQRDRYIHALVAEAFIGPRPAGMDVNHIDGNKSNNAACNLEYCTRKANINHAVGLGLINPGLRPLSVYARGDSHANAILTESIVRKMRADYVAQGGRRGFIKETAEALGVSQSNISMILGRKTWKHVH